MSKDETQKNCACTQNLQDLQATIPKDDLLRKITCAGCGRVFWTNSDKQYCFDCQANKNNNSE